MTPSARLQAAIEIVDLVIEAARTDGAPADRIVADFFRARRYAGSKDRRAVRDLVFDAIRACGPVPASGRAALLRLAQTHPELTALFDGSRHGPAPLEAGEPVAEGGLAPHWLKGRLAQSGVAGEEASALLDRAPLDLRVNTLKAERDTLALPERGEPLPTPAGLRFPAGTAVEGWDAYARGLIEVQDAGSQWACVLAGAQAGETVVDLCAGAGGKTLALAAQMRGAGRLVATDTDRTRLQRLAPRAERAGVTALDTRLLNPGQELERLADLRESADLVLVDAPCSGTGTWRRNPEARWRLQPAGLARLTATQDRLLEIASQLVRPGGRLVYVVCSLLDEEGADRVAAFLDRHPDFSARPADLPVGAPRGAGLRLSPGRDGCDGFFIAQLAKA